MANSANPADWHILRGKPFFARFVFGLLKPKNKFFGADFAGIVYGAKVTAVCSGKNTDFVKSLGADQVISYDIEDIHQHQGKYNLIVDTHGNLTHRDFTRMGQRAVSVGFTTMGHMMSVLIKKAFSKFPLTQFTAVINQHDLEILAALIRDRKIRAHIDKTYPYNKIPEAISYIEAMHTRGKVAMVW